jgi:hypothetical protein
MAQAWRSAHRQYDNVNGVQLSAPLSGAYEVS